MGLRRRYPSRKRCYASGRGILREGQCWPFSVPSRASRCCATRSIRFLPRPLAPRSAGSNLAATLENRHPSRYSPKMLKSLAQNCASSWTQSGHLRGKVNKRRCLAEPSPEATAFAALLGAIAGFGGPALLRSPWMRVLDRSEPELLALLRRAESVGLARIKAGGGVVQIDVLQPMAEQLEIPELGDSR